MNEPPRLSPEEAAAKADALIAQYRSAAPERRVKKAGPRRVAFGPRVGVLVAFVLGVIAGVNWRTHPAWAFMLGLPLVFFANVLVRSARDVEGDR